MVVQWAPRDGCGVQVVKTGGQPLACHEFDKEKQTNTQGIERGIHAAAVAKVK